LEEKERNDERGAVVIGPLRSACFAACGAACEARAGFRRGDLPRGPRAGLPASTLVAKTSADAACNASAATRLGARRTD